MTNEIGSVLLRSFGKPVLSLSKERIWVLIVLYPVILSYFKVFN